MHPSTPSRRGASVSGALFLLAALARPNLATLFAAVVVALLWPRASGPLALVSGQLPGALSSASERFTFDDASVVTLDAGARFAVRNNDGAHFDTVLEAGRVRLAVTPGGPRRWTIDCGIAKVVVVGTELVIDHQGAAVEVSVMHGRVLVRLLGAVPPR